MTTVLPETLSRSKITAFLIDQFGNREYVNKSTADRVQRILTDAEANHDHEFYGDHARFNELCAVFAISYDLEHDKAHEVTAKIFASFKLNELIDPNS